MTLDHRDSGMAGDAADHAPGPSWTAELALAAKEVAAVLDDHFSDVYGWERYVRTGPPAALDALDLAAFPDA